MVAKTKQNLQDVIDFTIQSLQKYRESKWVIRNCLTPSKKAFMTTYVLCQVVLLSHNERLIIKSDFLEFVYRVFFPNEQTPGAYYSHGVDSIHSNT